MSGVRRVRREMVERGRVNAASLAAAIAEVEVGTALAYVDENTHPRALAALQEAAAVLAVLGEPLETARAALAAQDKEETR